MASMSLQQVASLQDINKQLQEYNTSLQHYNNKLQSDVGGAAETISQIQKQKSTMMETLGSLRGHSAVVQDKLSVTKSSLQVALKKKKHLQKRMIISMERFNVL